ncbi:predicted protein [Arabidopsis lyrata subsp. lyrata]|uniref:Predicted protein n=1 Tax=Arabidopsis lyrata subsp. lyrata TaxID=81972 RepID=D7LXP2_ARALL|nr:predicted protein [Arabidopsis lyrata subsp. lyrata]
MSDGSKREPEDDVDTKVSLKKQKEDVIAAVQKLRKFQPRRLQPRSMLRLLLKRPRSESSSEDDSSSDEDSDDDSEDEKAVATKAASSSDSSDEDSDEESEDTTECLHGAIVVEKMRR